jgi:putative transposase
METLEEFIQSNTRPQELKRAIAVQMSQRGHSYREIRDVLQVSLGLITQSNQRYKTVGIEGLKLNYWGTAGYLNSQQRQELVAWLGRKDCWTLEEVIEHIEDHYGVVYQSHQSYYTLLKQAGLSWKKSHPAHPNKDEQKVEEKKAKL